MAYIAARKSDGRGSPDGYIRAAPGGELDVFMVGQIGSSGRVVLGDPLAPAVNRFYIGGGNGIGLSADLDVGAFLYLPEGTIGTSGDIEIYGGLIANNINANGSTTVHYDAAVLGAGISCDDEPGDGDGDGDGDGESCNTCNDCGNQACNEGVCGACGEGAPCCTPLLCVNEFCALVDG